MLKGNKMRPSLTTFIVTALLCCIHSYTIQPNVGSWRFRGHPISFDRASSSSNHHDENPVLLLNGFGVGSFHQHRLLDELVPKHPNRVFYAMDYLGQGQSWPEDCQDGESQTEQGLRYCGSTWVDQVVEFIEQVVISTQGPTARKVHLMGNSVGGHLAVFVAASRPDLVDSVTLLNATPVWGLNLPGWSGHLPAPLVPKLTGRFLFDRMRDFETINKFLTECYANPSAIDQGLVQQIRNCTMGAGGHAAFASILWSPPVTVQLPGQLDKERQEADFEACLRALQCDVLLIYGADDPWCKPAFAKRILQSLEKRTVGSVQRYVELSRVGHCPNHEAPNAVSRILTAWLKTHDRSTASLVTGKQEVVQEAWGETVVQERAAADIPLSWAERLATSIV